MRANLPGRVAKHRCQICGCHWGAMILCIAMFMKLTLALYAWSLAWTQLGMNRSTSCPQHKSWFQVISISLHSTAAMTLSQRVGLNLILIAINQMLLVVTLVVLHTGWSRCDARRSLQETKMQFPGVDFSLIQSEEDTMWPRFNHFDEQGNRINDGSADFGEPEAHVTERGIQFLHWLMNRYLSTNSPLLSPDGCSSPSSRSCSALDEFEFAGKPCGLVGHWLTFKVVNGPKTVSKGAGRWSGESQLQSLCCVSAGQSLALLWCPIVDGSFTPFQHSVMLKLLSNHLLSEVLHQACMHNHQS